MPRTILTLHSMDLCHKAMKAGDTETIWVYALLCLQINKLNHEQITQKCTCAQCTRSIRLANIEIVNYPMRSTWYWENLDPSLIPSPNDDSAGLYVIFTTFQPSSTWNPAGSHTNGVQPRPQAFCIVILKHLMFVDPHVKPRVHLWNFNSQFRYYSKSIWSM